MVVGVDMENFVGLTGEGALKEEKVDEVDKVEATLVLDRKL